MYQFFPHLTIQASYWSNHRHEINGVVLDEEGHMAHELFGKWNEGVFCGRSSSAKSIWRTGGYNSPGEGGGASGVLWRFIPILPTLQKNYRHFLHVLILAIANLIPPKIETKVFVHKTYCLIQYLWWFWLTPEVYCLAFEHNYFSLLKNKVKLALKL